MHDSPPTEQRLFGDRIITAMPLIWATIFYLTMALCLGSALLRPPMLRDWSLFAVVALCGASVVLFQRFYYGESDWPMRPRMARIYFGSQLLLIGALLSLSNAFIGLGFAIMGQTFGALRPRWWAVVLVPLFAMLSGPLGWMDAALRADWFNVALTGLIVGIWVLISVLLTVLFGQRFQLLDLVAELRRTKAELAAAAAQGEELAVLRERTRFAREMHDSIGHALVAANVKLEAAQRLYRVDAMRGDQELEATRELIRTTMRELRNSIADLRAPAVDHHDLPAALHRLAAEVAARGVITVDVAAPPRAMLPPPPIAEALFLIAREALINVERHARARRAELTLRHAHDHWRLEVADDGIGVRPTDMRKPGHFGLLGMRERAAALHGYLEVLPRAERGTLVVAHIPHTTLETA